MWSYKECINVTMATQTHKICLHIYHLSIFLRIVHLSFCLYAPIVCLPIFLPIVCPICISAYHLSIFLSISAYHLSCLSIYAYRLSVCLYTVSAYHQSLSMALSTLIRFRLKTNIFLSFLPFCPHWDGVFIFLKTLSKVDEFSHCVKTEVLKMMTHI